MVNDQNQFVVLDTMPNAAEFYGTYWNQKPFVVRGGIAPDVFDGLISAEELAGLSLEDAPQSRLMKTLGTSEHWSCRFGPFQEQEFEALGETDWTLLVQNVEQFHPDTGSLLHHFEFTPRWLMDDIMVSYSEPGGSVGPHIDNYHVFLVQGQGRRRWTIGHQPLQNETYIEGLDFKVLTDSIDGTEVDLNLGDILYLPPRFAHEGTTLESAMTFSVGFLGPKTSELLAGYGAYLSDQEDLDHRYVGAGLKTDSSGFQISAATVDTLRSHLGVPLASKDFSRWLVEFFTASSHEDFGAYEPREDVLSLEEFRQALDDGARLIKPEYVKFAVTAAPNGGYHLGFDTHSFDFDDNLFGLVQSLLKERAVEVSVEGQTGLKLLCDLYNHQALEFED